VRALLPSIHNVDGVVRTARDGPTSALHVAAKHGCHDVAQLLLRAGADPTSCAPSRSRHRTSSVTPLHLSADVRMAVLLLEAGASPVSLSPQQPDPVHFLLHKGLPDVAEAVEQSRAWPCWSIHNVLHTGPRQHPMATHTGQMDAAPASRQHARVVPAMSAAEVRAARTQWSLSSSCQTNQPKSQFVTREEECIVCMAPLGACGDTDDLLPLMELPCAGQNGCAHARPHVLHAACAEKWLLRKATCPICRRDLRTMLRRVSV
jgi:hypothetical protein